MYIASFSEHTKPNRYSSAVNTPTASSGVLTLAAVAKYPHECGYLARCPREENRKISKILASQIIEILNELNN